MDGKNITTCEFYVDISLCDSDHQELGIVVNFFAISTCSKRWPEALSRNFGIWTSTILSLRTFCRYIMSLYTFREYHQVCHWISASLSSVSRTKLPHLMSVPFRSRHSPIWNVARICLPRRFLESFWWAESLSKCLVMVNTSRARNREWPC